MPLLPLRHVHISLSMGHVTMGSKASTLVMEAPCRFRVPGTASGRRRLKPCQSEAHRMDRRDGR